jgi:WD40 repeat protein
MPTAVPDARRIFLAATEKATPGERAVFLDQACAGDAALRQRVEALLRAHDEPGAFLSELPPAPAEPAPTTSEPDRPAPEAKPVIAGRYHLLEEIGEGGMGTVWVAEQREPVKRLVAVKLIKPGMDSRRVLARFEAERQALALMDHPNIARVLDGGTTEAGRPYFVMELVKGLPLTEYCDERRLSVRERLELFVQICSAVQHAHQKGLIHRDLKPSNILVTEYDGKPVPKVIDFGLAKALHGTQALTDRTLHTAYGTVVGTPLYMAPEQVGINALDVDTRTDVYALGVILYELLTGTTPLEKQRFKQAAWDEVKRLIREEEPPRPSVRLSSSAALPSLAANRRAEPAGLSRLVRGELDWIVMRCLEKDRARRYETANGLAREVQRYLADEPVEACPPSAAYRLRKVARRHKAALATAGAFAGLLLAGAVVSGWQAVRARQAEREAAQERDAASENEQQARASETVAQQKRTEALAAQDQLRRTLYAAEMNLAQAAWQADNLPRARELLKRQAPPLGQPDLRGFEFHFWDRQTHARAGTLRLPGPFAESPLNALTFSRDGGRLATLVRVGNADELQVWDALTGRKSFSATLPVGPSSGHLRAFSADGGRVAVSSKRGTRDGKPATWSVRVWDVASGKELPALDIPGDPESVLLTLDDNGARVLTASTWADQSRIPVRMRVELKVWDVAARKVLLAVSLSSLRPGLALSPDGKRAAALVPLADNGNIQSPHGVKVWDIQTGKEVFFFKVQGEPFMQVVFSPDGKHLAATGFARGDGAIWVWDATTGKELRTLAGRNAAGSVVFSPDGRFLASYERDTPTVTLWDRDTGQARLALKGHTAGVVSAAFTADGLHLRAAAPDGVIRTWDVPLEAHPKVADAPFRFAVTVLSADGSRVASSEKFGPDVDAILILDAACRRVRALPLPSPGISPSLDALALSRSGHRVAARWLRREPGDHFQATVWDVASGGELLSLAGTGRRTLALSPDGNLLVVPFANEAVKPKEFVLLDGVKVWDVGRKQELRTIELRPRAPWHAVAFSPDGTRLATCPVLLSGRAGAASGAESVAQVWDVATGRLLVTLKRTTPITRALAFGPDGRLLAAAGSPEAATSGSAAIDVWDTATGQRRFTLKGHVGTVTALALSPDGTRLVSGGLMSSGADSEVRVWDLATGNELTTLSCRGGISDLAFRPDGHELLGVRSASLEWDRPVQVWDGTPRSAEGVSP